MFACLASDYPREPRAGEPDVLADADGQLAAGEIDAGQHLEIVRGFAATVLAEQESAGLGVHTDGSLTHDDRLRTLVQGLGGTSTDTSLTLPDGATASAPRFVDAPAWTGPITLDDWRWADEHSEQMVKQVIVGPYTLARLAAAGGAPREVLALGLAEALNAELLALAGSGCPIIQVDEGALVTIGDDPREWALYAETQRRLTAGLDEHHLSLGIYRGGVHPAGHASILDGPYKSYLFDGLGGPDAWRFALAVPLEMGLIVGAVDSTDPTRDETEVLVWAMAWAANGERTPQRIGVASNGSMRAIGRHAARRKSEIMGEAVQIATMGPLQEVAEALDPDPAGSKMAPLRRLAEVIEAARG